MPSLVSYLSGEFPKDAVHKTIDGLEKGGFVKLSPKQQKSGRTILSLELTEKGIELLGRLA
jgi:DNA-binding MarR family transcriptional regulator